MIEPSHPQLPIVRQCELLGLARASYYHRPEPETDENLRLMRVIDETYLAYPVFGSRQMARWLRRQGHVVNRKRVQRLMRLMGLEAIYQKPNTSRKHPYNPVYRYLLRRLKVDRPNQVWAMDITYVPIQGGFIYLCAVIDWYSRAVLGWELSNTLDAGFCTRTVARAIAQYGVPEIFNTDQGSQFTSAEFTQPLLALGVKLSMDGREAAPSTQRLRRAALADRGSTTRDLPEVLPLPDRGRDQPRHLLPLLQRPAAAQLPRRHRQPGHAHGSLPPRSPGRTQRLNPTANPTNSSTCGEGASPLPLRPLPFINLI